MQTSWRCVGVNIKVKVMFIMGFSDWNKKLQIKQKNAIITKVPKANVVLINLFTRLTLLLTASKSDLKCIIKLFTKREPNQMQLKPNKIILNLVGLNQCIQGQLCFKKHQNLS